MTKNIHVRWFAFLSLVLLIIFLINYFAKSRAPLKKTLVTKTTPVAVSPTPSKTPVMVPSGWKLYESNNFYFSFAYPPEKYPFLAQETERADADENSWRLSYYDATKEENLEALKNTSQIIIRALSYEYDLEHYAKIDYPSFFQDKQVKTITIGMIPAYEVEYTDTYSGIISTNVISFYRGHIYQITFASHNKNIYKEDLPLFENLISTFRFTD